MTLTSTLKKIITHNTLLKQKYFKAMSLIFMPNQKIVSQPLISVLSNQQAIFPYFTLYFTNHVSFESKKTVKKYLLST